MEGLRPFDCLQGFLRALERQGHLCRVSVEVDPRLEITEITTRVVRQGGPCLLFERVEGADFPLVINLFGHPRRIEIALGREPGQIGAELRLLAERLEQPSLRALWQSRVTLCRVASMRPARRRFGKVTEVEEPPDFTRLPVLTCWPEDGGPFITFGMTLTRDPESGLRNLGLYRLQIHDRTKTGMHWQIQKGGGFHYWEAEKRGRSLPASVILGGDPALMLAAALPLPEGMDEIAFAGFLRRKPVPVIEIDSDPAGGASWQLVADAELVIVGQVPAGERRIEGPFGDHLGHYSAAAEFPVFKARRWYRRAAPVYPAAVVGKPPQEDLVIGNAIQQMLNPLISLLKPEICDLWAYGETGFHGLTVVSVKQRYAREGLKTAFGVLGEGQLSLTKCVLLVDPGVDVKSFPAVLEALRAHFDPCEDLIVIGGTPYDTLDFTSRRMNLGSKMILDATASAAPRPPMGDGERAGLRTRLDRLGLPWKVYGDVLVAIQVPAGKPARALSQELVQTIPPSFPLAVLVSEDVDIEDTMSFLWGWFTRFEPAADLVAAATEITGAVLRHFPPVVIDATHKEGYQKPLVMDPAVVEKVDRRWNEYRICG